ncbi:glutathione S-transferase Mu 1-like [Ptychodera flava]|uniref:glutathione S-transferase Mu 1-like n=1 Tax=Ptychodera flava TaxID=63121 RepID=UPI00396A9319
MPVLIAYWKIRGLAQPMRYLVEYAGIDYKEKRYEVGPAPDFSRECWFSEKHTLGLPFPNLPYMIDGDVKLTQSNAILRYLARKANLLGTSDTEVIRVDLMAEQSMDLRNLMVRHFYNPKWEEMKENFLKTVAGLLKDFSDFLGQNPWFAGQNITFVDFVMYELMDQLREVDSKILDSHKNLQDFMARVEELPRIAAYKKSDRFMSRPINNKMAKFGFE